MRFGRLPKRSATRPRGRTPMFSRLSTASPNVREDESSSTTIRTLGEERSLRSIQYARTRQRPSQPRSRGKNSKTGSRSATSRFSTFPNASRASAISGTRCCKNAAVSTSAALPSDCSAYVLSRIFRLAASISACVRCVASFTTDFAFSLALSVSPVSSRRAFSASAAIRWPPSCTASRVSSAARFIVSVTLSRVSLAN